MSGADVRHAAARGGARDRPGRSTADRGAATAERGNPPPLFYDLKTYLADHFEILAIWHGGMSFHGGLIGVLVVGILFSWKNKMSFWKIADLIIVTAPIGLGLGRIGHFINGELYGRVTHVPWGMNLPDGRPSSPSSLPAL